MGAGAEAFEMVTPLFIGDRIGAVFQVDSGPGQSIPTGESIVQRRLSIQLADRRNC